MPGELVSPAASEDGSTRDGDDETGAEAAIPLTTS